MKGRIGGRIEVLKNAEQGTSDPLGMYLCQAGFLLEVSLEQIVGGCMPCTYRHCLPTSVVPTRVALVKLEAIVLIPA